MIFLPLKRPIYAAVEHVDFRRSFDVLVAIAREQLGLDVLRSAVVLFVNRDRTRCKILFHDGTGLVLVYKRLDAGRITLPLALHPADRSVRLEHGELEPLVAGSKNY